MELPEEVYERLIQADRKGGLSPVDWIAEKLPKPKVEVTPEERKAALQELLSHCVSLDHAVGADNEQIDADLARAYLDTHEPDSEAQ